MQPSSQLILVQAGLANSTNFIKSPKSYFSCLEVSSPVKQLSIASRFQRFVHYLKLSRTLKDPLGSWFILCSCHFCPLTTKVTPALYFQTRTCKPWSITIYFHLNSITLTQQYLHRSFILFFGSRPYSYIVPSIDLKKKPMEYYGVQHPIHQAVLCRPLLW